MDTILFSRRLPVETYADMLQGYRLVFPEGEDASFSKAELLEKIKDADALCCQSNMACDAGLIAAGKRLRVIATVSVGFNHIDLKAAAARNIPVVYTPRSVMEPTAELTIALMFACCRSIALYDRELRRDRAWNPAAVPPGDIVLCGSTLGVLGFGRIGRLVAQKAAALGMKIVYHDIQKADPEVEKSLNATWMPAETVLATADVVTLHMPYTKENHHFMNDARFAMMKPTAFLINAARGSIVSEQALVRALREGRIRGAGLDVFEAEPTISPELAALENLVMTPHAGTRIPGERLKMLGEALEGAVGVLRGETPYNIVSPDMA